MTIDNSQPVIRHSREHTGQLRMAYLLAEKHPYEICHVTGLGWFHFDGSRWVEDPTGVKPSNLLFQLLRTARSQERVDKDTLAEIISCERAPAINGILSIAAKLPEFHRTVEDLDSDPNLLNVANGTIDLLTCELRPHDPRDMFTKITRAAYRPEARSVVWERFVGSSLPDSEVRGFLQRYAGYALSGRVTEHILCILHGKGRNGKGVLYESLMHALGSYADSVVPEIFLENRGMHKTFEMQLRGLRLVTVSETGQGAQLAAATVKRLVGGDRITANLMRKDPVTFAPSHTPLMVTNHLPKVRGDDPALWARIMLVLFEVQFEGDNQIKGLPEQLELAADAILTWCLDGRRDYLARGLDAPEAVQRATSNYRQSEDAVEQFLEQVCDKDPSGKALFSSTYQRWTTWADKNGFPPLAKGEFRKALEVRGITVRVSTGKQNYIFGYTLPTNKLTLPNYDE